MTALGLSLTPAPSAHASIASIAVAPMAYTQAGIQNRNEDVQYGVRVARNQKGDPYVYGAAGPNAFDCSGLTSFSYGRPAFTCPARPAPRPAMSATSSGRTCAAAT